MPELPEVETVRRTLAPLVGRRVERVRVRRADVCTGPRGSLLGGTVVRELVRRGKRLGIASEEGAAIVVHLGMSGQLRLMGAGAGKPDKHVHVVWMVEGGLELWFRDPRRFGGVWAFADRAELERYLDELGPDALEIEAGELRERLRDSRRAIKAALLDQRVLAGVGNIYADEALFEARIRPGRLATRLTDADWGRLAGSIRATLRRAVDARGSTLRDYRDAQGQEGGAQLLHAVYGRAGEPCPVCGGELRGIRLAQRATVYCPRCQG